MQSAAQFKEERAELEAVLSSGIFTRSPSLATFLQYVCERYFEGQSSSIKEYNVAVEALGRPANFDQKRDSIVRVEAHRLRKRLIEYYQEGGSSHAIQICIPPGNYVPQFRRKDEHLELEMEHAGAIENGSGGKLPHSQELIPAVSAPLRAVPPAIGKAPALADRAPILLITAGLLGALIWVGWVALNREKRSAVPAVSIAPTLSGPAMLAQDELRILAGSKAAKLVDRYGNTWLGDQFFTGGEAINVQSRPIARTQDPSMFLNRREGNFSYDIPLKKGVYELHLYFAEVMFGENNIAGGGESNRLFSVSANGKPLLQSFDVLADAGGSNTADIKVFKDVEPADNGKLHLSFIALNKENPFVNAIEVLPTVKGKMRPIRIMASDSAYTDKTGQVWGADRYFTNGVMARRHDTVANTDDDELYRSERYGNFFYTIPVAQDGRYSVTLKFCESWFGAGRAGLGGSDSRLFDVYFNGRTLLHNFDLYKEAKGGLRALDKTFKGLEPDPQGKLTFRFVPVRNYALVNGIEVVDESR